MAESTSSGRTLSAVPTPTLTDWSGISLTHKKEVLRSLYPTCIVRAVIANEKNGASEAIYFEITKIKDGTCWGKVMDTYRFDDYVGLEDGRIFSFPLKAVIEVPISWQPKQLRKKLEQYLDKSGRGRAITGVEV